MTPARRAYIKAYAKRHYAANRARYRPRFLAGRVHIDHIRPCASFDLRDPDQQRACFHHTNLQPLWAADNLRKSDKVIA